MSERIRATLRQAERVHDMEDFGRVAVLMGGASAERDVSLASGKAVLEALRRNGVDADPLDPAQEGLAPLANYDRVFIALHGRGGEDGRIQGYLDSMGIPYTGSGVLGSAIAMDKVRSKQLWCAQGIPTPAFVSVRSDCDIDVDAIAGQLRFPLVVKPVSEGSSIGVSKVEIKEGLADAIEVAANFDHEILIEEWVDGAEYTVAILGEQTLPVIRIETSNVFYDYVAKYHRDDTRYLCPCGLDPETERAVQELALKAFEAIAASGWGRVDILCDTQNHPYVLEVNTVPGMTDHSLVPKAAAAYGIAFDELVMRILGMTMGDAMVGGSAGAMAVYTMDSGSYGRAV